MLAVVTYTVIYADDAAPARGVVVAERADGSRAVATTTDADVAAEMTEAEWCGHPIRLGADGSGSGSSFSVP